MGRIIQRKKSEGKKEDKINILKWSRDEWVKTVNVRLALYCVGWRQMKRNWSACKWMTITVISEVLNNFNCNVTFTIRVFCVQACKRRYHGNFNEPFRVLSMLKIFVYSLSSELYDITTEIYIMYAISVPLRISNAQQQQLCLIGVK